MNNKVASETALSYDDVLIQPEYSNVSRSSIDITPRPIGHLRPKIPIISSCMDTITELDMYNEMRRLGGFGVLHRYKDWTEEFDSHASFLLQAVPIAIGTWDSHSMTIKYFVDRMARMLVIDVAHGAHENAIDTIYRIKKRSNYTQVIAGNIATVAGAHQALDAGACALRVGVGPGSACSTRVVTGCGTPVLHSLMKIRQALPDAILIADGGIRSSGDIAKAIVAGADYVMIGGLLAGTDESPGEILERPTSFYMDAGVQGGGWMQGKPEKYKIYRGMASYTAQTEGNGKAPKNVIEEGEEFHIPCIGPVRKVINKLIGGLKQAIFYAGSNTLQELSESTFVQITEAGRVEGTPHGKK